MTATRLLVIDAENAAPYTSSTRDSGIGTSRMELLTGLSALQDEQIDVYFAQKDFPGIEDADNGLRYLRLNEEQLPMFGHLDFVVMIGGASLRDDVKAAYPDARMFFWPPEGSENWTLLRQALSAA